MFFRTSVLNEGTAKDLDAAGDFCDNCEAAFTEQFAVVELRSPGDPASQSVER